MDNCIFCKIASHQIPGKILYEDDVCMAFLDLSQTTNGHTLVIPKKHYQHVLDVDQETLGHMMSVVQRVACQISPECSSAFLQTNHTIFPHLLLWKPVRTFLPRVSEFSACAA